MHISAAQTTV